MEHFCTERRIYYHDTDCGGVVYYAKYLEHLEEGRAEFCLSKGVNLAQYVAKGIAFPVVHLEIEYKHPARYGDYIKIFTRLEKMGNSSLCFVQEIKKEDTLLVRVKTTWACVGNNFQPRPIPLEIRKALAN
ncbi:MAG: acyl-CoA thioesterase [Candidatus Omnitrophica bacterium]|nr:acyl-CoA thioesterase [Candidatus Omnitrophota bacterium]